MDKNQLITRVSNEQAVMTTCGFCGKTGLRFSEDLQVVTIFDAPTTVESQVKVIACKRCAGHIKTIFGDAETSRKFHLFIAKHAIGFIMPRVEREIREAERRSKEEKGKMAMAMRKAALIAGAAEENKDNKVIDLEAHRGDDSPKAG